MDSSAVSVFGELEDQVTCWVCFEVFDKPITLACNHTFCKECIDKILKKDKLCPFCRKPFSEPLPAANKVVLDLIAQFRKSLTKPKVSIDVSAVKQSSLFLEVPKDVIGEIMGHLEGIEVARCLRVCKGLNYKVSDNFLWRSLAQRDYPFCSPQKYDNSWKKAYAALAKFDIGWSKGRPKDFSVTSMRGHTNYINFFSQYRNNVVSGSADNTVKVWNINSSKPLHTLAGHTATVSSLVFNETGILSSSLDSTLKRWDATTGALTCTLVHTAPVNCVQQNGITLYSVAGRQLRVWDSKTESCTATLEVPLAPSLQEVQLSNHLVAVRESSRVAVFDSRTNALLHSLPGGSAFKLNGSSLVVGSSAGLSIYNLDAAVPLKTSHLTQPSLRASISCLDFDGTNIACGTQSGGVSVFSTEGVRLHSLVEHKAAVNSVQLDDRKVLSGSADNSIKVWNMKNGGKPLYTLLGGSLQRRANNPAHPTKAGCSQLHFEAGTIVASFNSLFKVFNFMPKS